MAPRRGSNNVEARSSGGGEGDGACRRLQRALLDRTRARNLGRGAGGYGEPRVSSPSPHLLFIALRDGGHQPGERLGAPDQGTDQGPNWPLGQSVENILTFSPLISPYDLNLTYFTFFHSIAD